MSDEAELERLRRVFTAYRLDPANAARWDSSNRGNVLIAEERQRAIEALLDDAGLWPPIGYRVIDVGCGEGEVLSRFVSSGAQPSDLVGVDLLPERIEHARTKHPGISFVCGDASRLDVPTASFRLAIAFTLFSSILDDNLAGRIATEIDRVLKPGGAVLWYDFRVSSPRNPHTRGMPRREIIRLFAGYAATTLSLTVFPPLVRRLGPLSRPLYAATARLSFLRTHYLALLRKPG